MTRDTCCIPMCNSIRSDVKLHKFPVSEIGLKKWLKYIKCDHLNTLSPSDLNKHHVCHKHFEKRFITASSRIRGCAYPTLFSPQEIASGIPTSVFEDTENVSPNVDHTYTRKRHYNQDHTYCKDPLLDLPKKRARTTDPEYPTGTNLSRMGRALLPIVAEPAVASTSGVSLMEQHSVPVTEEPAVASTSRVSLMEQRSVPVTKEPAVASTSGVSLMEERSVLVTKAIRPVHKFTLKPKPKKRIIHKVSALSPQSRKIYEEFKKARKETNFNIRAKMALKFSKEKIFSKLTKNMNAYAKKLFWMQIKLCTRKEKARRFTDEEKLLALSILKQSPKSYKFLQKIFILPSRSTMNKLVGKLIIETGINKKFFTVIKKEVENWKETRKYCSLIFDEVSIEPGLTYTNKDKIDGFVELDKRKNQFADHALVFVIKGALCKWEQAVAYYFCAGATSGDLLTTIIKQIVLAVGETGLIPVALISDQGNSFQKAYKNLQKETRREQILADENPDDCINIGEYKLSVVYDPSHLIKGLRNNFLTKNILFDDKISTWDDIVEIYMSDCKQTNTRTLPKLNDEHVIPDKIKKMKVRNCVRVLSRSVAAALSLLGDCRVRRDGTLVSDTMLNTAEVVFFFDELFDSVNGSSLNEKAGKDLRRSVTSTSRHHVFWEEAIKKLNRLKFVDKANGSEKYVPTVKNFITTLKSMQRLWKFFNEKNIKIIRPRNFNSDCIENFFGRMRAYNYRNNNPNCNAFQNTFKSLLLTGFIKFHSDSYNCEDESCQQLININQLFEGTEQIIENKPCESSMPSDNDFYETVQSASQERRNVQSRAYTTGWVVRKVLSKNDCLQCKTDFTTSENDCIHDWISYREYRRSTRTNLTYPTERAVRSFGVILEKTNDYLETNAHQLNIANKIQESIREHLNFDFVTCSLHRNKTINDFVQITMKLSIFNWCKMINKILRGTDIVRLDSQNLPATQRKALEKYKKKLKKK